MSHVRLLLTQRMARLRGQLLAEEPGARGIEHWARNPDCQRLGALILTGISPETAVQSIYHETLREGQSPFALLMGMTFERLLFEHDTARLIDLYHSAGILPASPRVVNLDTLFPHTGMLAMARRRALTRHYIQQKLIGNPQVPHIIIHGRLHLTMNEVPHDIEPDLLIASDTDACYRPGEIKSFPDRDGKTDNADLRGALRQTAVAVLGLRQLLVHWGTAQPEILVPAKADIILRVSGSSRATLRPMTLLQECISILAVIQRASQDFCALEQQLFVIGPHATLDQPDILDQIPNYFTPACKEFCPLARHCKKQALRLSEPIVLGNQAGQELAPVGTLARAQDLLNGHTPQTLAEHLIAQRLQEADREWQKAVT